MPDHKHVPTVIQFFDWFQEHSWIEDRFPDKLDWAAIGHFGDDRSSKAFYKAQFDYIRSLGIDALAWEYNLRADLSPTLPSPEALAALAESGLKICPFLDLEITFKVLNQSQETMNATLTVSQSIRPEKATIDLVSSMLSDFYRNTPPDLIARDAKDREIVFVFGYGFDRQQQAPSVWSQFAEDLVGAMKAWTSHPVFYWTFTNAPFLEHLLLHHREHFCAFHFVLDTPLAQFGHDIVTWNFGFDNLGASQRDGLERVVRNDLRYYKEMGWLAGNIDPAVVFIYSWNEAFEGSMLLPTEIWGDTKAQLAQYFIKRLHDHEPPTIGKTLLIVNDLNERPDDWHTIILREALWYTFRRLAPQSEVRTVSEALLEPLETYRYIIDFSVRKDESLSQRLLDLSDETTILFSHPHSGVLETCLTEGFAAEAPAYRDLNCTVRIEGSDRTLFVRDDLAIFRPSKHCTVSSSAVLEDTLVPLVARVGNRIWINAFTNDDCAMGHAFAALYGRSLGYTILYGEGHDSQRLLIPHAEAMPVMMELRRKSINGYWPIPSSLDLVRPLSDIDDAHIRFAYGLDAPIA